MSTRSLGNTTLLLLTDCLLCDPLPVDLLPVDLLPVDPLPIETAFSRQAAESLVAAAMRTS